VVGQHRLASVDDQPERHRPGQLPQTRAQGLGLGQGRARVEAALVGDAVTLKWSVLPERVGALVWDLPREAIRISWGFAGYLVLLFTVGMASIGVVLSRMNALDLSEAPAPTLAQARAWGAAVRPSAVGAILVPIVGMGACITMAALPALLGLIPVAGLIGALAFGLSLLLFAGRLGAAAH
jgi:hypothetical protein